MRTRKVIIEQIKFLEKKIQTEGYLTGGRIRYQDYRSELQMKKELAYCKKILFSEFGYRWGIDNV